MAQHELTCSCSSVLCFFRRVRGKQLASTCDNLQEIFVEVCAHLQESLVAVLPSAFTDFALYPVLFCCRWCVVQCQVQADGKTTLTVLPCLFEAGVETTYTLNWFCTTSKAATVPTSKHRRPCRACTTMKPTRIDVPNMIRKCPTETDFFNFRLR